MLLTISASHTNSADSKSKQGRQPDDWTSTQQASSLLWSLQRRWDRVLILYCDVGSISSHPRLATSSLQRMMNATEMSNTTAWPPSLGTSLGKRRKFPQACPDSHHHHLSKSALTLSPRGPAGGTRSGCRTWFPFWVSNISLIKKHHYYFKNHTIREKVLLKSRKGKWKVHIKLPVWWQADADSFVFCSREPQDRTPTMEWKETET